MNKHNTFIFILLIIVSVLFISKHTRYFNNQDPVVCRFDGTFYKKICETDETKEFVCEWGHHLVISK